MSVENPVTFDELMDFIEKYSATIIVRDFREGQVGNWPLASLTAPQALHHAFRWLRQAVVPARYILPQEQIEKLAAEAPVNEAPPEKEESPQ